MTAYLSFTFIDRGSEQSTVLIPIADPTIISGVGSAEESLAEFAASMGALSLGDIRKQAATINVTKTTTVPTNEEAQREKGLRFLMTGVDSGRTFTLTVPCADYSVLTFASSTGDEVVLADAGVVAAMVTDLEARYKPRWGATVEDVTVTNAYVAGRNS